MKVFSYALKGMLAIAAMTIATHPAFAQDSGSGAEILRVELRNGNYEVFKLSDKPVVTYNANECIIDCNSLTATYDMADIQVVRFDTELNEVETINASEIMIDLSDPNRAIITGVKPGNLVNVYSLSGTTVATAKANNDGRVELDLSGLQPSTIYIVSINHTKNFKLIRK